MQSKPLGLLSVGNVVNASIRLYTSNFGRYLRLSLFAHLWLIIPIYGWAKYCAEVALISRLCFGEITGQPESNAEARQQINQRFWSYLLMAINISLRLLLVYIAFYVGAVLVFLGFTLFENAGIVAAILGGLLIFALFLGNILLIVYLVSRWFVAELPLAVESGLTIGQSMQKSWQLTKNAVGRVQVIVFVAFLVTIPVQSATGLIPQFALIALDPNSTIYWVVNIIVLIFSLGGGALVLPFWKAVQALVYYDLRNRREGLDLDLGRKP